MGEHAGWRPAEIRAPGVLGGEPYDEGRGIGERDARFDCRPARDRWALQAAGTEQTEDAAKEALDTCTLAQFLCCPGRRQARPVLVAFGGPRHDSDCAHVRMD